MSGKLPWWAFLALGAVATFGTSTRIAAADVRVLALAQVEAPVEITAASLDAESRQLSVSLHNVGLVQADRVVVAARFFSGRTRTGGMLLQSEARIEPGGYAELVFAFEVAVPATTDAMVLGIDSISGATRGRYLPSEFWKSPVQASALAVEDAVALDSVESEQASAITPELGNSCCADCQSSAQGCGKNFFTNSGGNDRCRGICVTNYSCTYSLDGNGECQNVQCSFSCKPVESCC